MKLLKFEATWCGPCKVLSGIMEGIYDKIPVPVEIVDVDEKVHVAVKYGVRGVPTLILVEDDGTEIKRKSGIMKENEILAFVTV